MNKFNISILLLFVTLFVTGQRLDVMTYNVKFDEKKDTAYTWENRVSYVQDIIKFHEPDILGIQEAFKHQVEDIKSSIFGYKYIGTGRDFGDHRSEFNSIFYNSINVRLLSNGQFWLSSTPEIPSKGWDGVFKRICTWGLFQQKSTGKNFYVFNTHLDHVGKDAREKGIALILKKIKSINKSSQPTILMGDFNEESTNVSIVIQKIINARYIDTRDDANTTLGESGTFNNFDTGRSYTRRIDYIFVSSGISVEKYGVLSYLIDRKYPSDHFPVMVSLDINN